MKSKYSKYSYELQMEYMYMYRQQMYIEPEVVFFNNKKWPLPELGHF